jgi:hypothetical protein
MHGDITGPYRPLLYGRFPYHQFVLYDEEQNHVLAEGQSLIVRGA